ncbi:transposase [Zobellia uliginosa]|nr:transposase [Zobellia uliginosa]MDO6518513.1 transposase [Zobellia uliginosa]
MKKRQAIVEHPFGTIKRQWGFDHIITKKGLPAASADFGLIALAYNLKRLIKLGWKPETRKRQRNNILKMFLFFLVRPKYAPVDKISLFIKIQHYFRPISIVPQIA